MRPHLLRSIGTLATALCVAACTNAAITTGGGGEPTATPAILTVTATPGPGSGGSQFVSVDSTNAQFLLNGKPFFFGGTDAYDLPSLETFNSTSVTGRFDAMAAVNVGVARLFAFQDFGNTCDDASTHAASYVIQTAPGVYQESALVALDSVIKKAASHNVKLIMSLTNYWTPGGGICQYLIWGGKASSVSDFNANTNTYVPYFYQNAAMKTMYKNYVSMLINRVNTRTGVAYKNDPTIMAWELVNEPRGADNGDPAVFVAWAQEMAQYIKGLDSNHLVDTGEEGFDDTTTGHSASLTGSNCWWAYTGANGVSYSKNTAIPEIDFASIHNYSPYWCSPSDEYNGTLAGQFAIDHNGIAKNLGKPMLIGEYGPIVSYHVNDSQKQTMYSHLWSVTEENGIAGDLVWQFLQDGSPGWLSSSGANIYYTADSTIYPLFQTHNMIMAAKGSTSGPDTTAPTVVTGVDLPYPISSIPLTITATAADVSGITQILIYVNDVLKKSCGGSATCSWSDTYSDGTYSYKATAIDASSNHNSADSSVSNFTVLTPPDATDLWIYQDSLTSGWSDCSWGGTTNYSNTSQHYAGSDSASFDPDAAWNAISVCKSSLITKPSAYQGIEFYVYRGSTDPQLDLWFEGGPSTSADYTITSTANGWAKVNVDMSVINPTYLPFNRIVVRTMNGPAHNTYYIDSLRLVGKI